MNRPGIKVSLFVAILFIFSGCSNDAFFEEFISVNQQSWHLNELKEFHFDISDTTTAYRLILSVRNTTDYPYSNLYMFKNIITPDNTITRDTIECLLADRYGYWLGKGFGKLRENRFLIKDPLFFPRKGQYVITIQHAMRDEQLKGIADIGIRIEKTN